jgi:hypothetical protein
VKRNGSFLFLDKLFLNRPQSFNRASVCSVKTRMQRFAHSFLHLDHPGLVFLDILYFSKLNFSKLNFSRLNFSKLNFSNLNSPD